MLDRQKIEIVLTRRFPGASREQVAAAANAIMGIGDEWEEISNTDVCCLDREVQQGSEFRLLRRRGE